MRRFSKRRDDRLTIRLSPTAKAILERAADVERMSLCTFLLEKALEAAAETLAERREFRLSTNQYDALVAALDSPVKPKARLEQLITTPGVLK